MVFSKIESAAYDIAMPIASEMGYEIYDIIYAKEGPHLFLRIFITSENGVNLDDCEEISRLVSKKLDERDFIGNNYFLEISSPGIERVLRQDSHYENAVGEKIRLKLFSAVNGAKEIEGQLKAANVDNIEIEVNGEIISVDKKNIAKANIAFEF